MWFDLLKWLSEQEDATTIAELQRQIDVLVRIGKMDNIVQVVLVIVFSVAVITLSWWVNSLEKRIKKLEASLPEKRAD